MLPEDKLKRSPLVIIDTSAVREGKLPALEKAMTDLAGMVEAGEPETIAYQVFFDEQRERMTVIQVHPDSVSAEVHLKVAAPALPGFSSLVRMSAMDIYGRPGADLLERLQLKARMLGTGDVSVHGLHAGFARFLPEGLMGEPEEGRGLIARAAVSIHAPAGRVWHALTDPAAIRQVLFRHNGILGLEREEPDHLGRRMGREAVRGPGDYPPL